MKLSEATKQLEECEQGLRKLVAEAAKEGDYSKVIQIADLAKAVAALAEGTRSNSQERDSVEYEKRANPGNESTSRSATSVRKRPAADEYPKFFRRGDELVKIGWSKKDRKEYHHRAPRVAIDAVSAAIKHVGSRGRLFNGDALLPLKDINNGAPIPDYQAYVVLAWLKHLGLVNQHGRRAGYTLAADKQIDTTITAAWPELVEWRG